MLFINKKGQLGCPFFIALTLKLAAGTAATYWSISMMPYSSPSDSSLRAPARIPAKP